MNNAVAGGRKDEYEEDSLAGRRDSLTLTVTAPRQRACVYIHIDLGDKVARLDLSPKMG